MGEFLDRISWGMVAIACALLGLAPFLPEPHVWEKLKMLADGTLTKPVDMGDLLMHGIPWLILIAKLLRLWMARSKSTEQG